MERDYNLELSLLNYNNSDVSSELLVAAELGKLLLDRNQHLENSVREYEYKIEDQTREIQFLTKKSTTLQEVHDHQLRNYDDLERSVFVLQSTNKQLHMHVKMLQEKSNDMENYIAELNTDFHLKCDADLHVSNYYDCNLSAMPSTIKKAEQTEHCSVTIEDDSLEIDNLSLVSSDEILDCVLETKDQLTSTLSLFQDPLDLENKVSELQQELLMNREAHMQDIDTIDKLRMNVEILRQKLTHYEDDLYTLDNECSLKSLQYELGELEEFRENANFCDNCFKHRDVEASSSPLRSVSEDDASSDSGIKTCITPKKIVYSTQQSSTVIQIVDDNPNLKLDERKKARLQQFFRAIFQIVANCDDTCSSGHSNAAALAEYKMAADKIDASVTSKKKCRRRSMPIKSDAVTGLIGFNITYSGSKDVNRIEKELTDRKNFVRNVRAVSFGPVKPVLRKTVNEKEIISRLINVSYAQVVKNGK